jgi:hypothetical protein
MAQGRHLFPTMSYDNVDSEFIRDEIVSGDYYDLNHRQYVNDLIYVEWYAKGGLSPNANGLSAAIAAFNNWRVATKYPEAFDEVRREFGKRTRDEYARRGNRKEDIKEVRRWALCHRNEWKKVRGETDSLDETPAEDVSIDDRPNFRRFRFPRIPYDEVDSEFIRDEIRRGSFDDMEHRTYVNRLVHIEVLTKEPSMVTPGAYPPVRSWRTASRHPKEFDTIRAELGDSTRDEMVPINGYCPDDEAERKEKSLRHERGWAAVRESRTE